MSKPILIRLLTGFITLAIPVWLILTGVRLVASESFLYWEYNKPGFPTDAYGFTQEDRLAYAPYALQYLQSDSGIDYLGDLTLEDGSPMYNERELHHMVDVKQVMQAAFGVQGVLSVGLFLAIAALFFGMTTRRKITTSLLSGGRLTLIIIAVVIILSVSSWDFFFETFHSLFFASGTWRFYYSDTLIRLFPEQFWFDAALTIGAFTVIGASLLALGGWLSRRRNKKAADEGTPPAAS